MKIAVVIPCRNSASTLGGTLEALAAGIRRPDELLVVDGQSDDDTRSVAEGFGVRSVSNPLCHAAAGRQLGVESTCAEIVAFTDSDCLPAIDWLSRIEESFTNNQEISAVGGPINLSDPVSRVQAYCAETFESIMQFPKTPTVLPGKQMPGTLPGANGAYRRTALSEVGGFRMEFSNHAEEIDLQWRLVDDGKKVLFDPDLLVEHLGYPLSVKELIRTNVRYGFASTKLAKYHLGWRVDVAIIAALTRSSVDLISPWRKIPNADLSVLQLAAFQVGKIISSIRYGTVNI